jgi:hypothetical protein
LPLRLLGLDGSIINNEYGDDGGDPLYAEKTPSESLGGDRDLLSVDDVLLQRIVVDCKTRPCQQLLPSLSVSDTLMLLRDGMEVQVNKLRSHDVGQGIGEVLVSKNDRGSSGASRYTYINMHEYITTFSGRHRV